MTGYDKIKEYISTEPSISNDIASDLIEFINEVAEQEKVVNVPETEGFSPKHISSVVRSGASYTIKIKGDLKWQN